MKNIFITGTDTCIGKTVLSYLLLRFNKYDKAGYHKAIQTGSKIDSDEKTIKSLLNKGTSNFPKRSSNSTKAI